MLIHSAEITGSVQLNNTDVSAITNVAGFATTSSVSDLQSKTGSFTTISSFDAYSSSINTFTSSAATRLSTIESVTGSYATTGSNQFNGNQSISGSITSNGTITAQTLVVQTVTSSIEFVTGSTKNGSLAENTHQFTGSVFMSGSLGIGTSSPASGYRTHIVASGSNTFLGISNQGTANGDRQLRIGFGGAGADTYASIQGTRLSVADDVNLVLQPGGGNVGIGTISPGSLLTLSASQPDLTVVYTTTSNYGRLIFKENSTEKGAFQYVGSTFSETARRNALELYNVASGPVIMYTGATERMRITSAGDVAIGNTSPSTKLHVTGRITSNDLILVGTNSWSYTTTSGWTSYQTVIPYNSLDGGGVYLIRIAWGGGGSPYIVYGACLWMPVQSNGGSQDNEMAVMVSTHQGAGGLVYVRNGSVGGQASSQLLLRLANFADYSGGLTVTATRLM